MNVKQKLWEIVDSRATEYIALSDRIWGMPELAYAEHKSASEHKSMLQKEGVQLTEQLCDIPAAFPGEAGSGGPVIAFLGEYDALPDLSQEAGIPEPRPVEGQTAGHGCGHNLLGAGAMLAASAVKAWLSETGHPGRVQYYGCPAEEGGTAKTFMARDGVFNGVDSAISWHPAPLPGVWLPPTLANTRIDFAFTGRASHAASAPHLGRSALDACELLNIGVNYMREHMPSDARVHYAYLNAGGIAPNVVPGFAKVRYLVRAGTLPELNQLVARVRKIADAAAWMTETELETTFVSALSNLLGNPPLERALHDNMMALGPPDFGKDDLEIAARFQATLSDQDIAATWLRAGLPIRSEPALADFIIPLEAKGVPSVGSTDTGDVSWVVPTVQARGATCAIGTPFHTWQMTAQGTLPAAHKGMVHVAKAMAATALDLLINPELLRCAKEDHKERTAQYPYVCPIPADVKPPFDMSAG